MEKLEWLQAFAEPEQPETGAAAPTPEQQERLAALSPEGTQTPCPYRFFGSYRSLYALGGGKLLRCSGEFREKIYPLLEAKQQTMYLARKDLPTFCGCVLPALDGQVEIEDPQNLLQNYIPDSCTVCFYFDMEQDTLLVKPVFRYDTHSIAFDDSSEPDGVRRNKKEEAFNFILCGF